MLKKIALAAMAAVTAIGLAACGTDAQIASANLSKAADYFEVNRRIVFYNGITDAYIMTLEGRCSIKADKLDGQLEVTCMTGPNEFKKHFLGISDNVTYFVEHLDATVASAYHYRVVFKPMSIVPNIEFR